MNALPGSKSAGRTPSKPPRVNGRAVTTKTTYGTKSTYIFYTCIRCGDLHRVNEYGIRVTACHQGLVFVIAGGV
jgi:hypothetical protein